MRQRYSVDVGGAGTCGKTHRLLGLDVAGFRRHRLRGHNLLLDDWLGRHCVDAASRQRFQARNFPSNWPSSLCRGSDFVRDNEEVLRETVNSQSVRM